MSRLEEIKMLRSSEKLTPPGMLPSNHVTGKHLDWLISRVEEFEEELKSLYKHAKELSEENIPMSSIAVKKSIEKILEADKP